MFDTPIAENSLTELAGAGMAGLRPVFVHARMDFLLLSLIKLVNHASKWCYMSRWKGKGTNGGKDYQRQRMGSAHSTQCIHGMRMNVLV